MSELRQVIVLGPAWPDSSPFWRLSAAAPHLFETLTAPARIQQDRVHPVRVLAIDGVAGDDDEEAPFRHPRLLSLHLLVGHTGGGYQTAFEYSRHSQVYEPQNYPPGFAASTPETQPQWFYHTSTTPEAFSVQLRHDGPATNVASKMSWCHDNLFGKSDYLTTPAYYRTGAPAPRGYPDGPQPAEFQHVVATPELGADNAWPKAGSDLNIAVPAMRLLTGAIDLAVADRAFEWLSKLQPDCVGGATAGNQIHRYALRLRPDGIELRTRVKFPGEAAPIEGCFLLAPDGDRLILTLLRDRTAEAGLLVTWDAVWRKAMPAAGSEERLHGFRVAARSGGVPALRWPVLVAADGKTVTGLADIIEIPAQDIRLDLVSPRGNDGIDGVVNVSDSHFYLMRADTHLLQDMQNQLFGSSSNHQDFVKNLGEELVLAWGEPVQAQPESRLKLLVADDGKPGVLGVSLEFASGAGYRCAHDERRLAQALRQAYGLPSLPPGEIDTKRPMLYGFVPMDDGWLQLPIPNLPPADLALDSEILGVSRPAGLNVLAGFLRFVQQGRVPTVLSAFSPQPGPLVEQAPWSVTVEGAAAVRGAIALRRVDGRGSEPLRGAALLDTPELSTRGLLWISADRPDALEALPRLGAGAGAYLDVPLEQLRAGQAPVIGVQITRFAFHAVSGAGPAVVTGDLLALDIQMDRKAYAAFKFQAPPGPSATVYWRRHPRMPLVAQMSMTRSATSAVRPLESRDLVPFEIALGASTADQTPLAALEWDSSAQVFARLAGAWKFNIVARWPWPTGKVTGEQGAAVNGIGLCAFGVPGVELALDRTDAGGIDAWSSLRSALRYDLPALDEAFATATLPPVGTAPEAVTATPAPTVLEWDQLCDFWSEQSRRHQLARVAHSYLAEYKASDDTVAVDVTTLVRGLLWKPSTFGFTASAAGTTLPYGMLHLDGVSANGNQALVGLDANFSQDGVALRRLAAHAVPDAQSVQVVGYSPATFAIGDTLYDARGAGAAPMREIPGGLWRPLGNTGSAAPSGAPGVWPVRGLLSSAQPYAVCEREDVAARMFKFWFKDVPIDADGRFVRGLGGAPAAVDEAYAHARSLDPFAWQDGHLSQAGFEWRLLAASGTEGFEGGDDRIVFRGFDLEPLRLIEMNIAVDSSGMHAARALPDSVKILARLSLGAAAEWPDRGSSLVVLDFAANVAGDALYLRDVALDDGALAIPVDTGKQLAVEIGAIGWNKGSLALSACRLAFDFLESPVRLDCDAYYFPLAGLVAFTFAPPHPGEVPVPDTGCIAIHHAALLVGREAAQFRFTHQVRIAPVAGRQPGGPRPATITVETTETWSVAADNRPESTLQLLGVRTGVQFGAAPRGLTVTSTKNAPALGALIPGFPTGGMLDFGLVASIGAFDGDTAPLVAGQLCGTLRNSAASKGVQFERVEIAAEQNRRVDGAGAVACAECWVGALSMYGMLKVRSAIRWPKVNLDASGATIPFPPGATSGCTTVQLAADAWYVHKADWRLEGHELAFDTAAAIARGSATAVWTAPVMARHRLVAGTPAGKPYALSLAFTGVETIALGAMAAMVPEWTGAGSDAAGTTFAPRYRDRIERGEDRSNRTPGMLRTGEGVLGTVLQGAMSAGFRRACYLQRPGVGQLIVAGGFVGLLPNPGGQRAPLLRLPVLAGLSDGPLYVAPGASPPLTQDGSGNPTRVAWSDGAAALDIALTSQAAGSPKTPSERSLREAFAAAPTRGDAAMALLVEQSFPENLDSDEADKASFEHSPFYIAAAVSVQRTLSTLDGRVLPSSISLLAGATPGKGSGKANGRQRMATILRCGQTGSLPWRSPVPEYAPALMIVGRDLVTDAWSGGAVDTAGSGMAAGKAYAAHANPRAALLRDAEGGFRHVAIPGRTLAPQRRDVEAPVFADCGRGYSLDPGENPDQWLAGAEEGWTLPVRDPASGIAAMSRVAALPARAGEGDGWIVQQRAPVYLPLQTSELCAPPIGWLAPGAPRSRIPLAQSVDDALRRLELQPAPQWQSFAPEQLMSANLADRAGILVARRLRLETHIPGNAGTGFDPQHPRFGRPGQSSASFPRTERTPRPGPLPANGVDPALAQFRRRPCASPSLPAAPLRAVVGPADVVRGTSTETGVWSVTFIAAPDTAGMVNEFWDGTLRVVAELEISSAFDQTLIAKPLTGNDAWRDALLALLFPRPVANTDPLPTVATLLIDKTAIAFRRLHVLFSAAQPPMEKVSSMVRRRVTLVLDARIEDAGQFAGSSLPAIGAAFADALANGVVPAVALQLTVQPQRAPVLSVIAPAVSYTLTVPAGVSLPGGDARAPVALVMPLAPVLRARGALPTAPASLLFIDPAYDATLAAPPFDSRERAQTNLPSLARTRGDLLLTFSVDRRRVNRKGALTLMADLRFEKPRAERIQANLGAAADGDLQRGQQVEFEMRLRILPRIGAPRDLFVGDRSAKGARDFVPKNVNVLLAEVYELSLSVLVETDGAPASLVAGDTLELKIVTQDPTDISVLDPSKIDGAPKVLQLVQGQERTLRVALTDEPVVEPPPALYAALVRRELAPRTKPDQPQAAALSLPLYAQSPLPWRVDLSDAKADFRGGLMHRSATFVWSLSRPWIEVTALGVHVVKSDRNGQIYLPEVASIDADFVVPQYVGHE